MTSREDFAKEIEIDLHKYWLILKRRWLLIAVICGLTTGLSVLAAKQQTDEYKAEAKLLFESSNQASTLVGLEEGETQLTSLSRETNPLDTQVEIFRSIPIAQTVIQQLQLKDIEGELLETEDFLDALEVDPVSGTDVLQIAYTSPDPEMSAAVVNTITDIFIQEDLKSNQAAAIKAQEFISAQLPQSDIAVQEAESALRDFKELNGVVNLETESQNTVEVLTNFQSLSTELSSNLAGVQARIDEIQGQLDLSPDQAFAVSQVSEASGVQELLTQLQEVQSQLSLARTRYEEVHPEIANLSSQESALFSLLDQRVGAALGGDRSSLPVNDLQIGDVEKDLIASYLSLITEESALAEQLGEVSLAREAQQARAQVLPGLEQQQRELERRLTAAQTTYETLLESFQEAKVLENNNVGNARIVSPALVPAESTNSSLKLFLAAGLGLGTLMGVAAAFLVDLIDRSVKTVKEGQAAYNYPVLGLIPAWTKLRPSVRSVNLEPPQVLVNEPQPVPVVEAYQALQANLKFSSLDRPLKTIAVTSAVPGEGKSEVSANLALTLAHLGHRVLVVDADMRSPMQQHIWDIAGRQGLTNFTVGQLPLKNAIAIKSPNLHVLPVGAIPPNPLAILESRQVSALLRACEKAYDYIIIDTPPLLGLADSLTIGRLTDGLLLVMQPGRVDIDNIVAAKSMLEQSQQHVLGIVANGVKSDNKGDRYFYHKQEYMENVATEPAVEQPRQLAETSSANRDV